MASAVIRSFQLIAILATGSLTAQAQTAAPKAWVDPGAVERANTPAATSAPAAPAADAAKAATAKPGVDPKQASADSEKLKELIRASEAASEAGKAKAAASAHAAHHARHTAARHVAHASHAHAVAPKKMAAKVARHPVAYEYLPNKKDGPAPSSSGPISAAY